MKILIVEDEPAFVRELAETLQGWGYQVLQHLSSYEQTLQWLKQTEELPDAAILDLCLGGNHNRDGLKIADVLFKEYDIPFVFNSGLDDPSTAYLTAEYGAVQVGKGEWKSLKNALIQIEAGRKLQAHQIEPDSLVTYETARFRIGDIGNRGVDIYIDLSNLICISARESGAGRIYLYVVTPSGIQQYKNNNSLESFHKALCKIFPHLHLEEIFIRVSRESIVNKYYISGREGNIIRLKGMHSWFEIGEKYRANFEKYQPKKL